MDLATGWPAAGKSSIFKKTAAGVESHDVCGSGSFFGFLWPSFFSWHRSAKQEKETEKAEGEKDRRGTRGRGKEEKERQREGRRKKGKGGKREVKRRRAKGFRGPRFRT